MKKYFFFFVLTLSLSAVAQLDAQDKKLLGVIKKELTAGQKLLNDNPSARTAFRVFSSRVELLKLMKKEYVALELKKAPRSVTAPKHDYMMKFYQETKKLGYSIDKRYSKFEDSGRFYLIMGLMVYEFEDNDPNVPQILEKAIAGVNEKELKVLANGKLADYYFNKSKFKNAAEYYRRALRDDQHSEWANRYFYNLAWSYFKDQNYDLATKTLVFLYEKGKKEKTPKDYFFQQSAQKLPGFYLFSGEPDRGYEFIEKTKPDDTTAIFDYIKTVYEKGYFNKIPEYVVLTEKRLSNNEEKLQRFRIDMFYYIAGSEYKKNLNLLKYLRNRIEKYAVKKKLSPEDQKQFISYNKALLTPHLNIINRPAFSYNDPHDRALFDDSLDILKLLSKIDKKNLYSYRLRISQLYKVAGLSTQASKELWTDYEQLKTSNPKVAIEYVEEILALEDQSTEKLNDKQREELYTVYIAQGPKDSTKKIVYLKYFDMLFAKKNYEKAYEVAKDFHAKYPSEKKQVQLMFTKLLSQSLIDKNMPLFTSIKNYTKSDPILSANPEFKKIADTGYQNIVLEKINNLLIDNKGDKKLIAQKLVGFYKSDNVDQLNKYVAGFNAGLIYSQLGMEPQAVSVFEDILKTSDETNFKTYSPQVMVIAENKVNENKNAIAFQLFDKLYRRSCQLNAKEREEIFLKISEIVILESRYDILKKYLSTVKSCHIGEKTQKKVGDLLIEYMSYTQEKDFTPVMEIFNSDLFTFNYDFEKILENYAVFRFNELPRIATDDIGKIGADISTRFSFLKKQTFAEELKALQNKFNQFNMYHKEPLTEVSFSAFVEKNFELFGKNVAISSSGKFTYNLTNYLNNLIELYVFEEFLAFMDHLDPLVEKKENVAKFKGLLADVLAPYRKKLGLLRGNVTQVLAQEYIVLKHHGINGRGEIQAPAFNLIIQEGN